MSPPPKKNIWLYECLVIRMFGYTNVWFYECLVLRMFGYTNVWYIECLVYAYTKRFFFPCSYISFRALIYFFRI